ncbi:hypothetical protein C0971_04050 [Bacillus methanolicus]|nr:hypothetical protein C0971_04050 [Bacillus methanolicus]
MCSFPALSGIIKLENSIQEKRSLVLATSKDHAIDGSLDRGSAVKGNNPPEPQGWIIFLAFYSRLTGVYPRSAGIYSRSRSIYSRSRGVYSGLEGVYSRLKMFLVKW